MQQGVGSFSRNGAAVLAVWLRLQQVVLRLHARGAAQLEAERRRWILWLPVALGVGAALFFSLPDEPHAWCGWLAAILGMTFLVAARRRWRMALTVHEALLIALAVVSLGFALAQARMHSVAAPVLARAGSYQVEGRIIDIAPRPGGSRLVLDRLSLSRVPSHATPAAIRVNHRHAAPDLAAGDRVRLRARLQPPAPPALPGGFDFARQAYFERLGAVGYTLGTIERLSSADERAWLPIAQLRSRIAARIMEASPGTAGAVGAALIAGVRAGIDHATWREMQISGLAHLLSVSGLHMALVAGTVLTVCRYLLALIPPLALRFPVRKIAAVAAIVAAAFYLLLSGASVPTQRSFIMVAIALLAIIVDRNPFSMRLLAWSALAVLLLRPEAVAGASFQLSFAAVLALIAVYEAWRRRQQDDETDEPRRLHPALRYLAGVSVTTLIASAATTPFAAFHFQTIPTYGILANLLAVPLTSFVVMPAGLLGLLLLPFGLDQPAFQLMALGVEGVLFVARTVAVLPGASLLVHQWPGAVLVLAAAGGLWLALWQLRWRWLGLAPCALALVLAVLSRPPDLLVDPALGMAAVRRDDGAFVLLEWDRDRLVRDSWLRSLGVAQPATPPRPGRPAEHGIACDHAACLVDLGGQTITLARRLGAALEDCGRVTLVIARVGSGRCPNGGAIIGPGRLFASGGLAVTRSGTRLAVSTVADWRGDWPWSRRHGATQTRASTNESP